MEEVASELLQQRLTMTATNLWKIPIKQLGGQRKTSWSVTTNPLSEQPVCLVGRKQHIHSEVHWAGGIPIIWYLPAWKSLHVALCVAGSLVYWDLALLRSAWAVSAWYKKKMLLWSPDKFMLGAGNEDHTISSLETPVLTLPSAWDFIFSTCLGEATEKKKRRLCQEQDWTVNQQNKWTYKNNINL